MYVSFIHISYTTPIDFAVFLNIQQCSSQQTSGGRCHLKCGMPFFLFYEHGLIAITAYWMTVIHIPFTQLNVTSIGLGYYMKL